MKKIILMIVAVGIVSGCRKTDNPVVPIEEVSNYFPLAKGNVWIYRQTYAYEGPETSYANIVVQLDSPRVWQGIAWYWTMDPCPMDDMMSPTPTGCAGFGKTKNEILAVRSGPGPVAYQPETILQSPLLIGKEWTIVSTDTAYYDSQGNHIHLICYNKRYVRGFGNVNVPAGIMKNCVKIEDSLRYYYHVEYKYGGSLEFQWSSHSNEWFARDIGLVRQYVRYESKDNNNVYAYSYQNDLQEYNVHEE